MTTFGDYNKYIDTFYKVAFKDPEVAFYSYIDVKDVEPYFVGFVHIHDVISEPEDGYTSFRTDVLKVESFDEHKKAFRLGRAPAFGDYINKEPRDIVLPGMFMARLHNIRLGIRNMRALITSL